MYVLSISAISEVHMDFTVNEPLDSSDSTKKESKMYQVHIFLNQ